MKKIAMIGLLAMLCTPVFADEPMPRLVSVTGEGEVLVVPDEVQINFIVETFNEVLSVAKSANDEAIKGAFEVVNKFGIDAKDFRTDHFSVRNQEQYYFDSASQQQRSKKGFFVTKNVAITLRDITKFEDLYSGALEAGVNNINGVEFRSSEVKKHREEARKLAAQDAKQKAAALAAEMGETVGRAYSISENSQPDNWPRPMMEMAMMKADSSANNATVALGQIAVKSTVSASFELK